MRILNRMSLATRRAGLLWGALAVLALSLAACRPAQTPEPAPPTGTEPPAAPTEAELPVETEGPPATEELPGAGPLLRVTNTGAAPIENLVVLFPDDRIEFGEVPAGATTDYLPVPKGVYRYAAYELEVNDETVQLPVIDWVGEEPVPGEAFTYVLDFDPNRGSQWEMLQLVEVKVDR
jgi:hypothetical protein